MLKILRNSCAMMIAISITSAGHAEEKNEEISFWNFSKQPTTEQRIPSCPRCEQPLACPKCEPNVCCPKCEQPMNCSRCQPVCCPKQECNTCCPAPCYVDPCYVFSNECAFMPFRCNNLWASAEFLWWRICEGGLARNFGEVRIVETTTATTTTTTIEQSDKEPDFAWDPGVRVGLGYDFINGSDVGFYWTHFHQHTSTRDGLNRAKWDFHYDTIDARIGRKFWIACCFDVKPFAGFRYAQINQHLDTNLVTTFISPPTVLITTTTRDRQKFWGFGPQAGFQTDWYFACGFSLYGTLDGGILYGHFRTKFDDEDAITTAISSCDSLGYSCASLLVMDVGVGVRWEGQYVTLQAGLEHHRYSDFNQLGCSGSLDLFGANIGVGIHY